MKDSGKVLAFVLGAATAVVVIVATVSLLPLSAVGLATSKEVETLQLKVAGLDQALREFRAELDRQKQEAIARSAEEATRRSQAEEASKAAVVAALKSATAARQKAESEAAAQARLVQQREAEAMYQHALALESSGKAADAVRIYRRAARASHGKAALRRGALFDCGVPGVSRDFAESLQWYQRARDLWETINHSQMCRGAQ